MKYIVGFMAGWPRWLSARAGHFSGVFLYRKYVLMFGLFLFFLLFHLGLHDIQE